jgi:hypothetical protein
LSLDTTSFISSFRRSGVCGKYNALQSNQFFSEYFFAAIDCGK